MTASKMNMLGLIICPENAKKHRKLNNQYDFFYGDILKFILCLCIRKYSRLQPTSKGKQLYLSVLTIRTVFFLNWRDF